MRLKSYAGPAHRREEGIALVVVLLFTAIVLTVIVSTTATLALGARGGGADERVAYQALLAAESGQNTFATRYAQKVRTLPTSQQYRGEIEPTRLTAWLQNQALSPLSTGSGGTVALTFEGTAATPILRATGTTAAGARKEVLQNYSVERTPGFNMRIDAPLESYPNVDVRNNATVNGESGQSSNGTVTVARVAQPGGVVLAAATTAQSVTVNLSALSNSGKLLLGVGDYVQIGGLTYKVSDLEGTKATLTTLSGPPATVIANNADVNRIDSAVTVPFTQQLGQTTTVEVSDPTSFVKGSAVVVGNMQGRVEAIDNGARTISVRWESTVSSSVTPQNPASIGEGTPIRRDVKGVVSGYTVAGSGSNIGNGSSTDDSRIRDMNPFNPNANPDLFTHTFGQTKAQMLAPTGWLKATPTFNGTVDGSKGPVFYDGSLSLSGSQQLCGYGVLIVRGNLTVNGTCAAGFRGAIYVMGDYDQQGNSTINGAVVAEGSTQIVAGTECVPNPTGSGDGSGPGNSCDTKIAGTGQGSGKIQYDRGALLEAGSLLSPPTFAPVQGTWRQR